MRIATANWDRRYLALAELVASWSKDPSTRVGAVIVRPDKTIASLGFNGFPRRIKDDPALLADREEKYRRVVHAEMNAILNCKDPSMEGYTLYVWPMPPCDRCAAAIIQTGISRVVAPSGRRGRWEEPVRVAREMFLEAGIEVDYL